MTPNSASCPFCDYSGPSPVLEYLHDCLIFEPLNPVTEGHVVVVPKHHVRSAGEARLWDAEDSEAVAGAFRAAVFWAQQYDASNIIASSGSAATQTIGHLHIHVVPRREGDGLALPWTDQRIRRADKEVERLRAALRRIDKADPVTNVGDIARHALKGSDRLSF